MKKPRVYYKKGYLIEFVDGTFKLVNKAIKVSYEIKDIDGTPQTLPFNMDYFIYNSPRTKYGTIPATSIKDCFEIKYQVKEGIYHLFDATGKEFMRLT